MRRWLGFSLVLSLVLVPVALAQQQQWKPEIKFLKFRAPDIAV